MSRERRESRVPDDAPRAESLGGLLAWLTRMWRATRVMWTRLEDLDARLKEIEEEMEE